MDGVADGLWEVGALSFSPVLRFSSLRNAWHVRAEWQLLSQAFFCSTRDLGLDLFKKNTTIAESMRWSSSLRNAHLVPPRFASCRIPKPRPQTMSAQPALVSRATFTKEKIALLCLMNMVFERHSQDRNIPFEEIAARTKLPVDQVCACCSSLSIFSALEHPQQELRIFSVLFVLSAARGVLSPALHSLPTC